MQQVDSQAVTIRERLQQHLKRYSELHPAVSNTLSAIDTLNTTKEKDAKLLEACVYTANTSLLLALIKQIILFQNDSLQNAMQHAQVSIKPISDKHKKDIIEFSVIKLSKEDLQTLQFRMRTLSWVFESSARGSLLPFLSSYIKTHISAEKLLKCLPLLASGPDSEKVMEDLLESVDKTYQPQSGVKVKTP